MQASNDYWIEPSCEAQPQRMRKIKDFEPYPLIIGLDAQVGASSSLAFIMYFKLNFHVINGLPVIFDWMLKSNFIDVTHIPWTILI